MNFKRIWACKPRPPVTEELKELYTPWGETLDKTAVWTEHPHPQFARKSYQTLNGLWNFQVLSVEDFLDNPGELDDRFPNVAPQVHGQMPSQAITADAATESCSVSDSSSTAHTKSLGAPTNTTADSTLSYASNKATPSVAAPSADEASSSKATSDELVYLFRKEPQLTQAQPGKGQILVPFSPESTLSGVRRQLQPNELLVYQCHFDRPVMKSTDRCLLHFEAVDYECDCYINGYPVGSHKGGYLPFTFDITNHLKDDHNELILVVADPSDVGTQLRGKQKLERGGMWYTAQSGIWQSVWIEVVPQAYLRWVTQSFQLEERTLILDADVEGAADFSAELFDKDGKQVAVASATRCTHLTLRLKPDDFHWWSPEDPYLYALQLHYGDDHVESYCAFRSVEVRPDENGHGRFYLNGKPYFLKGVLDQGYWSDGCMTAPTDEALVYDIKTMQSVGFNMLRKHIKIECDRFYYHCDRLGMLVMQDMVCGGGEYRFLRTTYLPTFFKWIWGHYPDELPLDYASLGAGDQNYRIEWIQTCEEAIAYLRNHPSIITWVLFNEGWGQFRAREMAELVRSFDNTRPIDATSGWYDRRVGDYHSVHNYFRPLEVYHDYVESAPRHRAFFISEFGGINWHIPAHAALSTSYGYANCDTLLDWQLDVRKEIVSAEVLEQEGLAGFVYTQVSDVEEETNGILTYDRKINKLTVDPASIE